MPAIKDLKNSTLRRDLLTTGQLARVCGVAPATVSKWCDKGLLEHYRIPGSLDRRVLYADAAAFLEKNGMARAAEELARCHRLGLSLSAGLPPRYAAALRLLLPNLVEEGSLFGAGVAFGARLPRNLFVGPGLSEYEARVIVVEGRKHATLLRAAALLGEDWREDGWRDAGYAHAEKMPCDPEEWAAKAVAAVKPREEGNGA